MVAQFATFAGGCFWCLDGAFNRLQGVDQAISGYMGGHVAMPTYEQVCTGQTGHAEVVQIQFNPSVISYTELLDVFFALHDPTTLNRQGNDEGPQYRSVIFYHSPEQEEEAWLTLSRLANDKVFSSPIVTAVEPAGAFWSAEGYHQGYADNNPHQPYCKFVVAPKMAKFRAKFADRLKPGT